MSLSDLASLGSFVSGCAVLVSLLFLYFQVRQVNLQVRQSEKNQQAIIQQGRAARTIDMLLRSADSGMIQAWAQGRVGNLELSDLEVHQFIQIFRAFLLNIEDSFYQHRHGLLGDTGFASQLAGIRPILTLPGSRGMWRLTRSVYEQGFAEFIDGMLDGAPQNLVQDLPAAWRKAVAAERAESATKP